MIPPSKTVIAIVKGIRSPREELARPGRNFYILATDVGKLKGFLGWRPSKGQRIKATSRGDNGWTVDKYDGLPAFEFAYAEPHVPTDTRDVLNYAASLTRGIGDRMASAIWEKHGPAWRSVCEGDVPGLVGKVYAAFRETISLIDRDVQQTAAIAFLCDHGASLKMANAAWEAFGPSTIGRVSENCYVLATLPNHSFHDVDSTIRRRFGIGDRDDARIRAAILYFMGLLSQESTVVPWEDLFRDATGALGFCDASVSGVVKAMFRDGTLVPFKDTHGISLRRFFDAENGIFEFVEAAV